MRRRQDVKQAISCLCATHVLIGEAVSSPLPMRILCQSHLLKFRVVPGAAVTAPLLLALLSCPVVGQIRAKQFTADIIDTLGNRYSELVLPIPTAI